MLYRLFMIAFQFFYTSLFECKQRKVLFLMTLLLSKSIVYSQTKGNHSELLPVFREISYPYLPISTSNAIFFSSDGLMWFSSANGLVSFDGSEVIYHSNPEQTSDFDLRSIYVFAEDASHNFYMNAREKLIYFDRKKKTFYQIDYLYKDTKSKGNIVGRSFYFDNNGQLFIGGGSTGLFIYDTATRTMEHFNLDSTKPDSWQNRYGNTVTDFLPDKHDASLLWLGTYNGIYEFNKVTKKFRRKYSLVNPYADYLGKTEGEIYPIEHMDMQNDSTIWFNFYAGAFGWYNTHNGEAHLDTNYRPSPKNKIRTGITIPAFTKIDDSLYLLGIKNISPAVFNTKKRQLWFFRLNPNPNSFDAAVNVTKDLSGNIWIKSNGTWYVSVPAYCRLQTKNLELDDNYKNLGELRGVYFDTSSHYYYCAVRMSNGVHVFDSNFNFIKIIKAPLFTNYYTNHRTCTDRITKDGNGRFWTTGWETYVMLPGKNKFDHIEKVFPSMAWIKTKGEFYDVLTMNNGDVLLAESNTRAIYHINHKTFHTDTIRVPLFSNPQKNSIVSSFVPYDRVRNLLYLLNDDGIAQYNFINRELRIISPQEIFGSNAIGQRILKVSMDSHGRLWLLKENFGIRIIDPVTLNCIDSIRNGARGFINGYYVSVTYGGPDCMLFQSRSGIVLYDYVKQHSIIFDATNGLSFPEQPALLYANQHMVVGLRNWIQFYDTRLLNKNNFYPTPQVNTILADTSIIYTRESFEQKEIRLKHDQNNIAISFSTPEFIFPERIEYAYQLENVNDTWQYGNYLNHTVSYNNLAPGKYAFHLKAQMHGGNWTGDEAVYTIIVNPAWWQTDLFKFSSIISIILLVGAGMRYRILSIKRKEHTKRLHEKELYELEAKALRAQMNPHFIFNCLNSIKALIQNDNKQHSIVYLTTFSKLIRTLFHNSDKRQISLYDEIETCKLYTQLEAMRLNGKLRYNFNIDSRLDLKSVMVPALIIQPLIENAIWHGIAPKDGGTININVTGNEEKIICEVDDDGIGREMSKRNKPITPAIHESRGIRLSQARLNLEKMLNETDASIETIDKYEKGGPSGTKVVLSFTLH